MAGGLARVRPVPVTDQDLRLKAVVTARPRRPEAPVMRAAWEDMVVGVVVGLGVGMRLRLGWRGYMGSGCGRDGMMSRCLVYGWSFVYFEGTWIY
jgi:hypothetical protein